MIAFGATAHNFSMPPFAEVSVRLAAGTRLQLDAEAQRVAVLAGVNVLAVGLARAADGHEVPVADDQHADDLVASVAHVQGDGEEHLVCG